MSCGLLSDKVDPNVIAAPKSHKGHAVLSPEINQHYVYDFKIHSRNLMQPTANQADKNKKQEFLINATLWQSTCSGQLDYRFVGFKNSDVLASPIAHFKYLLKDFKFEEKSMIKDGHTWDETYGLNDKAVSMSRDKTKRVDHMNEMIGDPRKWYIDESEAQFLADGRSALYKTNPIGEFQKARYMSGSSVIGQYFFKGIKIEEIGHSVGTMLPPQAAVDAMKATSWRSPLRFLVNDDRLNQNSPTIFWNFDGKKKFEGRDVLHVRFQAVRQVQKGKARMTGEVIQGWSYRLAGWAYLDVKDKMPVKIDMKRDFSWVDFLPYQRDGKQLKHQMLFHQYSHHIIMTRQLDQPPSRS